MTLFSLPFFCFCATTATTPLRHSSSSSSVAAAAAAPAVPSSCCSHFLDFRSLNFSSISGKFRFLLGLPGVSCCCFLFPSLFFSFLFVSGNPCQTSVAFVASWFLSLVSCIDRAVDLGLEFLRFCVFSALSFESGVDERCMYYLLRDFEKI
jgi:hypothetical protein